MNAETEEALKGLKTLLKELDTTSLIDSSDAERVQAGITTLEAAEARAAELETENRRLWGRNDLDVHEGMAWCDRAKAAEARAEALEERLLRVVHGEFGQICSYCGWESKRDGADWEDLQQHIRECPKHPMRALEAERDKNREWALAAEAEVRKLKQEHVEQGVKRDALETECRRLQAELQAREEMLDLAAPTWRNGVPHIAFDPSAALTPPEAQGREESLPPGLTKDGIALATSGPYRGWVFIKHADGQWVTAAQLDEFSMGIAERRATGPQGGAGEGKP